MNVRSYVDSTTDTPKASTLPERWTEVKLDDGSSIRLKCFGTLRRRLGVAMLGILPAFAGSVSHQLYVQVRPEVAISRQGEATLLLKIRLAPGAQATLWNAKTCDAPDPGAYRVVRSGIYSIPLSVIAGPADAGTCLVSSDGAFAVFLPSNVPAR